MRVVEREASLAVLDQRLADAIRGHGGLVWVTGEAGLGKSILVNTFTARQGSEIRVLAGACDPLSTPRPLGPFVDMAGGAPDIAELLNVPVRHRFLAGFLDVLSMPGRPTIVVIEDMHWADESTLDLVRYLGRRIHGTFALVLATYRPDELHASHPLRGVVGDLATAKAIGRIELDPLSPAGVAELAADHDVDAGQLHRRTGGNPFFVTEVLAHPTEEIPATVRDAVLARRSRLPEDAHDALDLVSVAPGAMELSLLERIVGPGHGGIDACVVAGMLEPRAGPTVGFRHELARLAIAEAIPPARWRELNATVCAALLAGDHPDPARVAHHADIAGDGATVLTYGVTAARRAADKGAHREAAQHLRRVLGYADRLDAAARADLLEFHARELRTFDETGACEAAEAAVELRRADAQRQTDRAEALASSLTLTAECRFLAARSEAAHDAVLEAIDLLDRSAPTGTLAIALSSAARLKMLARDLDGALTYGARAIELATRFDEADALSRALNAVGSAEILIGGRDQGERDLRRSVEVAEAAGLDGNVVVALLNLGSAFGEVREYERAERYLRESIAYAAARDQDRHRAYSTAWLARVLFETGRWDEAGDVAASLAPHRPDAPRLPAIVALTVLGRLRARRGDPGAAEALDRAWELAVTTADLQRLWPAAAARAEAAILDGEPEVVPVLVGDTLTLARELGHAWAVGELSLLLHQAGHDAPNDERAAAGYALHLQGDHEAAAAAWRELGCPFEEALALSDGDSEQQLRALRILDELGANRVAAQLRQRMRDEGQRAVPRGPRASTASNPAGLTDRQVEVVELVADGLTNAEIAARLFISEKTAGHHVSAILAKLGVAGRGEAARRYREMSNPT